MKVSILIPVYNSERYLRQTIESALAQTWENKEIIIVDDGSSDSSLAIAKSFESARVKVISQINGGACRARNVAFAHSTGDYIQYLDADDLLSSDKIKNQMLLMLENHRDVIFSCTWKHFQDAVDFDEELKPNPFLDCDWSNPIDWLVQAWIGKGMATNSSWLTPRHLIEKAGPWNEALSINQDGEFFCRVLLAADAIKYSKNSFSFYRKGIVNSVSQTKGQQKASDLLLSYALYEKYALRVTTDVEVKKALTYLFYTFIYRYFDQYPDLTKAAEQHILRIGINRSKVGSIYFRLLTTVIGFKNALRVRLLFDRLK